MQTVTNEQIIKVHRALKSDSFEAYTKAHDPFSEFPASASILKKLADATDENGFATAIRIGELPPLKLTEAEMHALGDGGEGIFEALEGAYNYVAGCFQRTGEYFDGFWDPLRTGRWF